ncbi:MAG TPA: ribonuclease III [Steroidobacteraceae bacterium]|nr:ribonuclease III [Steroidobacteraceae bacterium]
MSAADWPERWLQQVLGHPPRDAALFRAALTHRSAAGPNNERLEFLGDAVLNLVVAERLYRAFPSADEGDLSRLRARLVSREPLAEVAGALGVGEVLQLGAGELKSGGFRRQSILADAFEALCGALYLDGGLAALEPVIERLLAPRIAALPDPATLKDAKTRLQEYLQARSLGLPRYRVERIEGEAHAQTFSVSCEVADLGRRVHGGGSSRRRAEQEAAERMLSEIAAVAAAEPSA